MKKVSMEIFVIKEGTTTDDEGWIEMKTVNDIFQVYKILNEKDRKKMLKEFYTGA